ncbi:glycosyltransferase family 2 protein [Bacteroides caecimuris]|jgi:glycosyltransferase involved in cell wall biosynthesis|uniref:glycosyltransferase family 2 protein n=1 Tax=Bacteroides caecimuris TaxID=1796613 RepID=UPI0025711E06|nr:MULTISPECIES: glycosyltransferase [Bacteroides]
MLKISIIIPVYKVEQYLRKCIDSVLCQSYRDYEIILVDDGSPDSSPQICDEYTEKDKRVKVIHKKNGGLSDARNAGIEIATGDYLVFLDSDDWWDDNNALEDSIAILNQSIPDVLIFGFKKYFQRNGNYSIYSMDMPENVNEGNICIKDLLQRNIFITSACTKFVKRSFFEGDNGIRFVKGQLSEDIEYNCKLLEYCKSIEVSSKYFYIYRQQNSNSITANKGVKNLQDIAAVIVKYAEIGKNGKNEPLLHYIALQYVLWLTVSNVVEKSKISDLMPQMRQYWWLTEYSWCPYVKRVSKVRWLGFKQTRKLLGLYKRLKNVIKT